MGKKKLKKKGSSPKRVKKKMLQLRLSQCSNHHQVSNDMFLKAFQKESIKSVKPKNLLLKQYFLHFFSVFLKKNMQSDCSSFLPEKVRLTPEMTLFSAIHIRKIITLKELMTDHELQNLFFDFIYLTDDLPSDVQIVIEQRKTEYIQQFAKKHQNDHLMNYIQFMSLKRNDITLQKILEFLKSCFQEPQKIQQQPLLLLLTCEQPMVQTQLENYIFGPTDIFSNQVFIRLISLKFLDNSHMWGLLRIFIQNGKKAEEKSILQSLATRMQTQQHFQTNKIEDYLLYDYKNIPLRRNFTFYNQLKLSVLQVFCCNGSSQDLAQLIILEHIKLFILAGDFHKTANNDALDILWQKFSICQLLLLFNNTVFKKMNDIHFFNQNFYKKLHHSCLKLLNLEENSENQQVEYCIDGIVQFIHLNPSQNLSEKLKKFLQHFLKKKQFRTSLIQIYFDFICIL